MPVDEINACNDGLIMAIVKAIAQNTILIENHLISLEDLFRLNPKQSETKNYEKERWVPSPSSSPVRLPKVRRRGDPSLFFVVFSSSLFRVQSKLIFQRNQMIFGQDRVSYDDFDDCHNEISIADIDFISKRPIYGLYLQGDASGSPLRG